MTDGTGPDRLMGISMAASVHEQGDSLPGPKSQSSHVTLASLKASD